MRNLQPPDWSSTVREKQAKSTSAFHPNIAGKYNHLILPSHSFFHSSCSFLPASVTKSQSKTNNDYHTADQVREGAFSPQVLDDSPEEEVLFASPMSILNGNEENTVVMKELQI